MMLTRPQGELVGKDQPPDRARKILRYTPIAILIAAIYVGFVLFFRWRENRDIEAKAKAQAAAQQRTEDQQSLENTGGTKFDILSFYATPGIIHRGDTVQLCYGVANAQNVKIEPDTNRATWPSVTRCIEISPKKTTTYTLTTQDAHGNTKTANLTIQVH
jgi:hypothetical protein